MVAKQGQARVGLNGAKYLLVLLYLYGGGKRTTSGGFKKRRPREQAAVCGLPGCDACGVSSFLPDWVK